MPSVSDVNAEQSSSSSASLLSTASADNKKDYKNYKECKKDIIDALVLLGNILDHITSHYLKNSTIIQNEDIDSIVKKSKKNKYLGDKTFENLIKFVKETLPKEITLRTGKADEGKKRVLNNGQVSRCEIIKGCTFKIVEKQGDLRKKISEIDSIFLDKKLIDSIFLDKKLNENLESAREMIEFIKSSYKEYSAREIGDNKVVDISTPTTQGEGPPTNDTPNDTPVAQVVQQTNGMNSDSSSTTRPDDSASQQADLASVVTPSIAPWRLRHRNKQ